MLTLFTAPKPFAGHIGVIQRNALRSWVSLGQDVEVIVFGDEPGIAETCRELRLRHEPELPRNQWGTPLVNYLFTKTHSVARHDLLCYSNCDIVLPHKLLELMKLASSRFQQFLLAGRRWDLDVTEPLDFGKARWGEELEAAALRAQRQRPAWWIDFFAFRGMFFRNMPPFAVGRPAWDNWFIRNALAKQVPVLDVSKAIVAVHENHDYRHHPGGVKGVAEGPEAIQNRLLAGRHLATIDSCTYEVTAAGQLRRRGWQRHLGPLRFFWVRRISPALNRLMDQTLSFRSLFGLRRTGWLGSVLRQRNS